MKGIKKKNNTMFVSIFLILWISLLLFSVLTIIIIRNVKASIDPSSGGASSIQDSTKNQMGICAIGAGGPCNGDSNFDGRDDRTGKCILSNGCGGDVHSGRTGSASRPESSTTSASSSVVHDNNATKNENLGTNSNHSTSIPNANSSSHTFVDGLILKN
jgi:hypothetical protein